MAVKTFNPPQRILCGRTPLFVTPPPAAAPCAHLAIRSLVLVALSALLFLLAVLGSLLVLVSFLRRASVSAAFILVLSFPVAVFVAVTVAVTVAIAHVAFPFTV